ncbi:MAG: 50S ribosomal protein L4 [Candidatus Buchananbacteria bacterium]|nr:50S ribosomal protein L4 [Candidatus Buchananbacteria bacterium]
MATVKVYNQQGTAVGEEKLNDAVFGVAIKPEVVQQVVVAQQANSRKVVASTKDRSEVRGGGRKPWRQKGTGRARHGSIRSPLWRGGGITFGPTTDRNFSLKINKKVKRKAMAMGLTDKLLDKKLIVLDNLELAEGKTKKVFEILQNFKLRASKAAKSKTVDAKTEEKKTKTVFKPKNVLILSAKDDKVKLAARNIPKVEALNVNNLNLLSILKAEYLLAPIGVLKEIEKRLTAK